ncbi:Hypothetical protein NTJ_08125 [Nesidiocoris tenuis]|nr:Hypothetical protein NTJ_08125 [Nesidiocoris tenuis]
MVDLAETGKRRGKGCRRALGLVNGGVACDLDPDSLVTRPGRDSEGEGVPQGRGQGGEMATDPYDALSLSSLSRPIP